MKRIFGCVLLSAPLLATAVETAPPTGAAAAETEAGREPAPVDERIREQLDALELNYDIDEDNDFYLTFEFDDGRTQTVWIRSRTYSSHELEMRDVWSYAYEHSTKYLPEYLERRLLIDSYEQVIGGWAREGNAVVYMVKLPADIAAEVLQSALYDVAEEADDMELEITGADVY